MELDRLGDRLTPSAPAIQGFTASNIGDGLYTFTGAVTADANPYCLWVSFSGSVASVDGLKAMVQSDGSFSLLVELQTDGSDQGTVYAEVTDWDDLTSAAVGVSVDPA